MMSQYFKITFQLCWIYRKAMLHCLSNLFAKWLSCNE